MSTSLAVPLTGPLSLPPYPTKHRQRRRHPYDVTSHVYSCLRRSTTQVNISKIARCLFILAMLMPSCVAYSRIEHSRRDASQSVYFKMRFCEPVSESRLRRMMGSGYDIDRMTNDEEEAKRNFVSDTGYLEDEPSEDYVKRNTELDDAPEETDKDFHVDSFSKRDKTYQFMRKKRDVSRDNKPYLQVFLNNGSNKKKYNRRSISYRQKVKLAKMFKRKLPWKCAMLNHFELKDGYFPRYVRTGSCKKKNCFYNFFRCEPQFYRILLLKRDPNQCNPLPKIGANTTYEEKWDFIRHTVTVGCNCVHKRKRRRE